MDFTTKISLHHSRLKPFTEDCAMTKMLHYLTFLVTAILYCIYHSFLYFNRTIQSIYGTNSSLVTAANKQAAKGIYECASPTTCTIKACSTCTCNEVISATCVLNCKYFFTVIYYLLPLQRPASSKYVALAHAMK